MLESRIVWQLSTQCNHACWYCLPKYKNYPVIRPTEEYLRVIDLLQNHGHRKDTNLINWHLTGGEPLQLPNLNLILKAMKAKASVIKLETSGGESWFDVLENIKLVDELEITHHYWQSSTVLDYIIDVSREENKKLKLWIPLLPDQISQGRDLVKYYQDRGVNCHEQALREEDGSLNSNYSLKDKNIYLGRPIDWVPPPRDKNLPDPNWKDPRIGGDSPSYTGRPCYAGVDYLFIDGRGFAQGSHCGGRDIGNVFSPNWRPPDSAFACSVMFCHSQQDRKYIRIIKE